MDYEDNDTPLSVQKLRESIGTVLRLLIDKVLGPQTESSSNFNLVRSATSCPLRVSKEDIVDQLIYLTYGTGNIGGECFSSKVDETLNCRDRYKSESKYPYKICKTQRQDEVVHQSIEENMQAISGKIPAVSEDVRKTARIIVKSDCKNKPLVMNEQISQKMSYTEIVQNSLGDSMITDKNQLQHESPLNKLYVSMQIPDKVKEHNVSTDKVLFHCIPSTSTNRTFSEIRYHSENTPAVQTQHPSLEKVIKDEVKIRIHNMVTTVANKLMYTAEFQEECLGEQNNTHLEDEQNIQLKTLELIINATDELKNEIKIQANETDSAKPRMENELKHNTLIENKIKNDILNLVTDVVKTLNYESELFTEAPTKQENLNIATDETNDNTDSSMGSCSFICNRNFSDTSSLQRRPTEEILMEDILDIVKSNVIQLDNSVAHKEDMNDTHVSSLQTKDTTRERNFKYIVDIVIQTANQLKNDELNLKHTQVTPSIVKLESQSVHVSQQQHIVEGIKKSVSHLVLTTSEKFMKEAILRESELDISSSNQRSKTPKFSPELKQSLESEVRQQTLIAIINAADKLKHKSHVDDTISVRRSLLEVIMHCVSDMEKLLCILNLISEILNDLKKDTAQRSELRNSVDPVRHPVVMTSIVNAKECPQHPLHKLACAKLTCPTFHTELLHQSQPVDDDSKEEEVQEDVQRVMEVTCSEVYEDKYNELVHQSLPPDNEVTQEKTLETQQHTSSMSQESCSKMCKNKHKESDDQSLSYDDFCSRSTCSLFHEEILNSPMPLDSGEECLCGKSTLDRKSIHQSLPSNNEIAQETSNYDTNQKQSNSIAKSLASEREQVAPSKEFTDSSSEKTTGTKQDCLDMCQRARSAIYKEEYDESTHHSGAEVVVKEVLDFAMDTEQLNYENTSPQQTLDTKQGLSNVNQGSHCKMCREKCDESGYQSIVKAKTCPQHPSHKLACAKLTCPTFHTELLHQSQPVDGDSKEEEVQEEVQSVMEVSSTEKSYDDFCSRSTCSLFHEEMLNSPMPLDSGEDRKSIHQSLPSNNEVTQETSNYDTNQKQSNSITKSLASKREQAAPSKEFTDSSPEKTTGTKLDCLDMCQRACNTTYKEENDESTHHSGAEEAVKEVLDFAIDTAQLNCDHTSPVQMCKQSASCGRYLITKSLASNERQTESQNEFTDHPIQCSTNMSVCRSNIGQESSSKMYKDKLKWYINELIKLSLQEMSQQKTVNSEDKSDKIKPCVSRCAEAKHSQSDIQALADVTEAFLDKLISSSCECEFPVKKLYHLLQMIIEAVESTSSEDFQKLIQEITADKFFEDETKLNKDEAKDIPSKTLILGQYFDNKPAKTKPTDDMSKTSAHVCWKMDDSQEKATEKKDLNVVNVIPVMFSENQTTETKFSDNSDERRQPVCSSSLKEMNQEQLKYQVDVWFKDFKDLYQIFNRQCNIVIKTDFMLATNREKLESLSSVIAKSTSCLEFIERSLRECDELQCECLSFHSMYLNPEFKGRGERETLYTNVLRVKQSLDETSQQKDMINEYIREQLNYSCVTKITRILNCYANTLQGVEYKIQMLEKELQAVKYLSTAFLSKINCHGL